MFTAFTTRSRPRWWRTAVSLALATAAPARGEPTSAGSVEVEVEGTRPHSSATARERATSASVITGDRLVQPGTTAAQVLREAPGVQVTEIGGLGAPATASVRGATAAQTPIYFGGMRVNDEVGGAANLADLPLFLIERIEIYRSHAPLFADRLGIGGAIFLEPRRARSDEVVTGAEFGSHGLRSGHVHGAALSGGLGLLAGVQLAAADNDYPYTDDRGTLFATGDDARRRLVNADVALANAWLLVNRSLGRAETELVWHHGEREQGAPKLALLPAREARNSQRRDALALRSRVPIDAWNGELGASLQAVAAETAVHDPLLELGPSLVEIRSPGQRVEQSFEASQRPVDALWLRQRLGIALDRLQRLERRSGRLETALSARRLSSRLSAAAELEVLPTLFVDTTLGLECSSTSQGELETCSELEPDGRVGASLRRATWELYANAGRYYRKPTLGELHGMSLLIAGNPRLGPERGQSFELGARLAAPRREGPPLAYVDGAVFTRRSDALITHVRTAQGYLTPTNRNRAEALGAELLAATSPTPWLEASAQLSLLDLRDTSPDRSTENDVLPFVSRLTGAALLTLRHAPPWSQADEVGMTLRWLHQSSRYADPAGLGVIPRQSSVDLELFSSALGRKLMTRVRLANALDARRFDIVGFPLPGRSVFASLEATW